MIAYALGEVLVTIHLEGVLLKDKVLGSRDAKHTNNLIIESKRIYNGRVRVQFHTGL